MSTFESVFSSTHSKVASGNLLMKDPVTGKLYFGHRLMENLKSNDEYVGFQEQSCQQWNIIGTMTNNYHYCGLGFR